MGRRVITFAILIFSAATWPFSAVALAAAPQPVSVESTQDSCPIDVSQAQILTDASGSKLWIVYRNRSESSVARFEITAKWQDAGGRTVGVTRRIVREPIGPGEATTTEIPWNVSVPGAAKLVVSISRARFNDLALWTAPPAPPPSVARASIGQALTGPVPITAMADLTQTPNVSSAAPAAAAVPAATLPPVAAPVAEAPAQTTASAPAFNGLAQGTQIGVQVLSDATSATAVDGERIEFTVVRGASSGSTVVIPLGARGVGHLEQVRRAGRFGRSGSLTFVPDAVESANGSLVPLQGSTVVSPPTTALAVLADMTILGGLFARGRDAVLSTGSVVTAATASSIALTPTN